MEMCYLKEEKDIVGEVQHHHCRRPHADRKGYSLVQKLIAFMQMVLYGYTCKCVDIAKVFPR